MYTIELTRYFTNGEVNIKHSLSFNVLNNNLEKAHEALKTMCAEMPELPHLENMEPWREMTDTEARVYQEEQEEESQ